jgi:predicted GIY-YIG superfamily endonuclease
MTAMTDSAAIFVYILECSDRTLFAADEHLQRLEEHSTGKAGPHTPVGRRPFSCLQGALPDEIRCLKREREIKRLSRAGKLLYRKGVRGKTYLTGAALYHIVFTGLRSNDPWPRDDFCPIVPIKTISLSP